MRYAYATAPESLALVPVADVRTSGNHATVVFYEGMLAAFADGALRPFMLLTKRTATEWPAIDPEALKAIPGVRIWADTAKSKLDHRGLVWRGWIWPDDGIGIVKPVVPVEQFRGLSHEQSGFLQSIEGKHGFPYYAPCSIPGCARKHPPAVPICGDHFAKVPAAERTRYWNDPPGRLAMLNEWRRRFGTGEPKKRKARPIP